MPDKNRSTKNVGKLIAKLESMPKIALTVIDTIKTPRRPKESPKPPHRYPPIIIPRKTMAESTPLSVEVNRRSHSADGNRNETHL